MAGEWFTGHRDFRGNREIQVTLSASQFNENSRVAVSVTELTPLGDHPMLGGAGITVRQVVPSAGLITVWVYLDIGNDINFRVSYIAHNP